MGRFAILHEKKDGKMNNKANVFVSYSWDSDAHRDEIKKFIVDPLRELGINVISDFDTRTGVKINRFMEKEVPKSEKVIVVLTPKYADKVEKIKNGALFEEPILSTEMMGNLKSEQIIPVFKNNPRKIVPPVLEGINGLKFDNTVERKKGICEMREAIGIGSYEVSKSVRKKNSANKKLNVPLSKKCNLSQLTVPNKFTDSERIKLISKSFKLIKKQIKEKLNELKKTKCVQTKFNAADSTRFTCFVVVNERKTHAITVKINNDLYVLNRDFQKLNGDIHFFESGRPTPYGEYIGNGGFLLENDESGSYWVMDHYLKERFDKDKEKLNESDMSNYLWKIFMDNAHLNFN